MRKESADGKVIIIYSMNIVHYFMQKSDEKDFTALNSETIKDKIVYGKSGDETSQRDLI